jgi:predicted RNA-binding protein YlqC (UPF0109 family)
MNYEQIILDIVTPLVSKPESLKAILMDQENLYETSYVIYCDEKDVGRLIGKKGIVAEAIREVVNASAKLNSKKIRLKFEVKK